MSMQGPMEDVWLSYKCYAEAARKDDRYVELVVVELPRAIFRLRRAGIALDAGWACLLEQAIPMCASCAGQRAAVIANVKLAKPHRRGPEIKRR